MKNADKKAMMSHKAAPASGIYFMGIIGSAIYFVSNVDGFWNIILALLKSLVWPAFLIHRVFELLHI
jgi:hypothetical protein